MMPTSLKICCLLLCAGCARTCLINEQQQRLPRDPLGVVQLVGVAEGLHHLHDVLWDPTTGFRTLYRPHLQASACVRVVCASVRVSVCAHASMYV